MIIFIFFIDDGSFFDNIERISSDDFIPIQEDILHTKIRTTGVNEIEFEAYDTKFCVILFSSQ